MNSSDPWTRVSSGFRGTNRGGSSSVEFPPEAAAAFGSRRPRMGGERPDYHSSSSPASSGFPEAAVSAFSKRPATNGSTNGSASAFGGGGGARSTAVRFSSALSESLGLEEEVAPTWTNSAFSKKLTAAKAAATRPVPPKKQTYEEMFPVLAGTAAAPKVPAPENKPSLASLLRKKNEEEEAAAADEERMRLRQQEEAARAGADRHMVIGSRYRGTTTVKFHDYEDEEEERYDHADDLDVDSYGLSRAAPAPKPSLVPDAPPDDYEEDQPEADEAW
jgi:hypothetical protein